MSGQSIVLLRLPQVIERTGWKKSEIYSRIKRGLFPRGQRLSHKVVVWPEPVIAQWQRENLPDDLKALLG